MTDPFDKATSTAPATLGEGCLSRYDPQALSPQDGTEFSDARALWLALHPQLPRRTLAGYELANGFLRSIHAGDVLAGAAKESSHALLVTGLRPSSIRRLRVSSQ